MSSCTQDTLPWSNAAYIVRLRVMLLRHKPARTQLTGQVADRHARFAPKYALAWRTKVKWREAYRNRAIAPRLRFNALGVVLPLQRIVCRQQPGIELQQLLHCSVNRTDDRATVGSIRFRIRNMKQPQNIVGLRVRRIGSARKLTQAEFSARC